jgi:hypothetical protein
MGLDKPKTQRIILNYMRSGAVSGIISTSVFTVIHHIFIADIWFSFLIMASAGMICGVLIGGSYGLLFTCPSFITWLKYNFIFVVMFLLLGLTSIIIFEPVTTVSALMKANERPDELIQKAFPMTLIFTILAAVIISILYGHRLLHYFVILLTCAILMMALGLNVSILGLVYIPTGSVYLILELFALIITILTVYAFVFMLLEKKNLSTGKKESIEY